MHILKTQYFLACLIFSALYLSTATSLRAQLLIGPVAGAQASWVSFDDDDSKATYKQRPVYGFHAGMQVSFKVRKRFFLHTSLLYSQKGKNLISSTEDTRFKNKLVNNYIEVPILYTVEFIRNTGKGKAFKYYLGLGPNISYWLGGKGTFFDSELFEYHREPQKYKLAFGKDIFSISESEMSVQDPTRLQLGLNFSAGLVFEPIQDRKFMLNLRYELGHTFLSNKGTFGNFVGTGYSDDLRVRNQGVRVSLAYLIDLKTDQRKRGKSTVKKRRRV
jgi:hypothetical protein